jgi:hypothetical protein
MRSSVDPTIRLAVTRQASHTMLDPDRAMKRSGIKTIVARAHLIQAAFAK